MHVLVSGAIAFRPMLSVISVVEHGAVFGLVLWFGLVFCFGLVLVPFVLVAPLSGSEQPIRQGVLTPF